jgi:hypothetical protein
MMLSELMPASLLSDSIRRQLCLAVTSKPPVAVAVSRTGNPHDTSEMVYLHDWGEVCLKVLPCEDHPT